jgi:PTS system nitrogen regulatory IIA component
MSKRETLSVEDVARLLQIPSAKVRRWVRQGRIPCRFKGDQCLFKKSEVTAWARARDFLTADSVNPPDADVPDAAPSLTDAVARGGIFFGLPGTDREAILRAALDRIVLPDQLDKDEVLEKLIERERIASTGIGRGVAIPHPRQPLDLNAGETMIPVMFTKTPVDFRSVDGDPVFVLFFLFSPSTRIHLKLLARLSYLLRDPDFLAGLRKCREPGEILKLFRRAERLLDSNR